MKKLTRRSFLAATALVPIAKLTPSRAKEWRIDDDVLSVGFPQESKNTYSVTAWVRPVDGKWTLAYYSIDELGHEDFKLDGQKVDKQRYDFVGAPKLVGKQVDFSEKGQYLTDIAVFNRKLSSDEIAALYQFEMADIT